VGEEFLLEDDKLIYNNYAEPPAKHIKTYSKLGISQNDTSMILSGPWKTNRTKDYHGITGNIFLQKKKKIQEALIIAKLENLQLAGSLSFMTPQARPGDITAINIHRANDDKSQKQIVGNAEEVVSNKPVPANVESQQTTNQSKAGIQASEKALNKKDTAKEKTQIKNVQLPVADIAIQKDKTINTIATGETLNKPGNPQTDPLQKTDKKIPEAILKKDHSTVSADTIKKVLLPVTGMPIPKNETAAIVPIKTGAAQISKPIEADKKIPNKVEKKEESGVNKGIIKPAPS